MPRIKKEQINLVLSQASNWALLSRAVFYLSLSIAILGFTFITLNITYEELLKVIRILSLGSL